MAKAKDALLAKFQQLAEAPGAPPPELIGNIFRESVQLGTVTVADLAEDFGAAPELVQKILKNLEAVKMGTVNADGSYTSKITREQFQKSAIPFQDAFDVNTATQSTENMPVELSQNTGTGESKTVSGTKRVVANEFRTADDVLKDFRRIIAERLGGGLGQEAAADLASSPQRMNSYVEILREARGGQLSQDFLKVQRSLLSESNKKIGAKAADQYLAVWDKVLSEDDTALQKLQKVIMRRLDPGRPLTVEEAVLRSRAMLMAQDLPADDAELKRIFETYEATGEKLTFHHAKMVADNQAKLLGEQESATVMGIEDLERTRMNQARTAFVEGLPEAKRPFGYKATGLQPPAPPAPASVAPVVAEAAAVATPAAGFRSAVGGFLKNTIRSPLKTAALVVGAPVAGDLLLDAMFDPLSYRDAVAGTSPEEREMQHRINLMGGTAEGMAKRLWADQMLQRTATEDLTQFAPRQIPFGGQQPDGLAIGSTML